MHKWLKRTPLLLVSLLTACATSKPQYVASPCPEQWHIPQDLKADQQVPQKIQDLTNWLNAQSQPASNPTPNGKP